MASLTREGALVLIVEDDEEVAALIAEVAEYAGYSVLVAHNGNEALGLARERWPALLITDLLMPELGGTGLIAALRAAGGPNLPTILVTSLQPEWWSDAGADEVLPKPFHLAALESLLTRFLPI